VWRCQESSILQGICDRQQKAYKFLDDVLAEDSIVENVSAENVVAEGDDRATSLVEID